LICEEGEEGESGLARIGNAYFMIRSKSTGTTHAINPKTKLPYCGWKIKYPEWGATDELPDDKHQPTCKICLHHYDDPLREELYEIKRELEETISEFLFMQVHIKNADGGLGRFVETVAKFMRSERKLAKEKTDSKGKEATS
jgi:hypothetical protein